MTSIPAAGMTSFYAMRRANGDWFAVDDNGHLRMPIFRSSNDAMIARSRNSGMECFRPMAFDAAALQKLRQTEGETATFFMVSDPSRKLKHGLRMGSTELAALMITSQRTDQTSEHIYRNVRR